jgi:DMSO reductase anchor subunit
VLSVAGSLFLLTGVYTALLLMILRREGLAETWAQAWPVIAAGLALALLQIYAIDTVRYHLTHTWGGFGLGG